jgi:APA family basic amino acid/polyamine antiporter
VRRSPNAGRPPGLGIVLCGYLMVSLPGTAWERFVVWLVIGLVIYFAYSRRSSRLATPPAA